MGDGTKNLVVDLIPQNHADGLCLVDFIRRRHNEKSSHFGQLNGVVDIVVAIKAQS